MKRRELLLLSTFLMLTPRVSMGQEPHTPFPDWVRRFYLAQIAVRARQEGWADAQTEAGAEASLAFPFQEYLTSEMQALYVRATTGAVAASDVPDGSILDDVFGWGALPNRSIKVVGIDTAPWWRGLGWDGLGGGELAVITLEIAGNERDLTLKGHYEIATFNWEIADIDYGDGSGETLRERLERLAK